MEMALNKGFSEISQFEMTEVNGGGVGQALAVGAGVLLVSWAPVAAVLCPPAGIAMACSGIGVIGKATGAY